MNETTNSLPSISNPAQSLREIANHLYLTDADRTTLHAIADSLSEPRLNIDWFPWLTILLLIFGYGNLSPAGQSALQGFFKTYEDALKTKEADDNAS